MQAFAAARAENQVAAGRHLANLNATDISNSRYDNH